MDFDGEIQITPFNMKEELEEGHFDKQGMYIYDNKQVCILIYMNDFIIEAYLM